MHHIWHETYLGPRVQEVNSRNETNWYEDKIYGTNLTVYEIAQKWSQVNLPSNSESKRDMNILECEFEDWNIGIFNNYLESKNGDL